MTLDPWLLLMLGTTAGAAAFAAWAVFDLLRIARAARARALEEIVVTETESPLMRALLPTARNLGRSLRALCERPVDHPEGPGPYRTYIEHVQKRLLSAGQPEGINADEYVGFSLLSILVCTFLGAVLFLALGRVGLAACLIGGAVLGALRMPGWLRKRLQRRHHVIRRELPFALDLLTLAMEAGLDFTSALDRIVRKLGATPLGEEFRTLLREIRLGKSRSEAMRDLGRRVDVLELRSVVSSLVQAEEMGSNIGPILRIQAEQQRQQRSQRAEEAAGKAPVKMLFPLLLFLLVTLLLILGPIAIEFFL